MECVELSFVCAALITGAGRGAARFLGKKIVPSSVSPPTGETIKKRGSKNGEERTE
jgi:hypothetical protein